LPPFAGFPPRTLPIQRQSHSGLPKSTTSIKQEEMPDILKSTDLGDVVDLTIDGVVELEQKEVAIHGVSNDLDNVIDLTLDD